MSGLKGRKRLARLWLEDSKCHWCRRETSLFLVASGGGPIVKPSNAVLNIPERATIDHLVHRLSGKRRHTESNEKMTVLACYKCNHRRGIEDERKYKNDSDLQQIKSK